MYWGGGGNGAREIKGIAGSWFSAISDIIVTLVKGGGHSCDS